MGAGGSEVKDTSSSTEVESCSGSSGKQQSEAEFDSSSDSGTEGQKLQSGKSTGKSSTTGQLPKFKKLKSKKPLS